MAIQVSHSTYYISIPSELEIRLNNLAAAAAFAQILGNISLFNQAKDAYHKLGNEWYDNACKESDKKSYKNWLGGGETYLVLKPLKWDIALDVYKPMIEFQSSELTKEQKQIAFSYLLNHLSELNAFNTCFENLKNLY